MIRFEHVNRDVLTDDMTEMLRNNPPDVVYAAFRDAFFKNAIRMVQRDNEMRNIVLTDAAAREKATRQGEPTQTIPTGFAESKQARDQEEAPWRGSNRGFRKHRQNTQWPESSGMVGALSGDSKAGTKKEAPRGTDFLARLLRRLDSMLGLPCREKPNGKDTTGVWGVERGPSRQARYRLITVQLGQRVFSCRPTSYRRA